MKNKIIFFLLFVVVFLLGILFFSTVASKNKKDEQVLLNPYLTINNSRVNLSIADTPDERERGLSYQKKLMEMPVCFLFSGISKIRSFWMKDMNFPLDIVWINDNKIVKIDKNLPPEGEKPEKNYSSGTATNYVLELNAGFCDEKNIKVGDKIQYFLN